VVSFKTRLQGRISYMIATILIAFREFLEAFLIVGIFLGLSKQLNLKKELEIWFALAVGIAVSFALAIGTYVFGDQVHTVITESNAMLVEGYLLMIAGAFLAYVVFSLHRAMHVAKQRAIQRAKENLTATEGFDFTLFISILAFILREGFEIALFTASVALFADFLVNLAGLFIGFGAAAVIGTGIYFFYTKLPISKIFTATEYAIIAFGAVMTASGIMTVGEDQLGLEMGRMAAIPLPFVADPVSMLPVAIVGLYVGAVYYLFMRPREATPAAG